MKSLKSLLSVAICATGLAGALDAQQNRLFVLPGPSSISTTGTVYVADSLTLLQSFTAPSGSYKVLARPDGQRFYVVSTSNVAPVTAVDQNGGNLRILSTGQNLQANAVALSPDGRRLLMGIGANIYVFDTTQVPEVLLNPSGLAGAPSDWRAVDISFSLDSTRAFVLLYSSNTGSRVAEIDLSSNSITGTVDIPGQATGISTGPNSLIYVSTVNQILEYDGRGAIPSLTLNGTFSLNGKPGKPVFTPNGRYLLAANTAPAAGQSLLFAVDLNNTSRVVTPLSSSLLSGVTFSDLIPNGNNRFVAYSISSNLMYDLSLAPGTSQLLNLNMFPAGIPTSSVQSVALSNELAITGRNSAVNLYYVNTSNSLYQIDINSQAQKGLQAGLATGSIVAYGAAATTSGTPSYTIQINDLQTAPVNGTFLPLVLRVLDANGRPLSNLPVVWSASGGTITTPTNATTNANGYTTAQLASPTATGSITVTAQPQGGQAALYSLAAGSSSGGGGGGTVGGTISIVSGNGQLVPGNYNSAIPLTVMVKDSSGTAVSGAVVTWTVSSGSGTMNPPTSTTDSNGLAQSTFLATVVPLGYSFQQSTVNAAAANGNSVNFTQTTYITTTAQGGPAVAPSVGLIKPTLGDNLTVTVKAGATITDAIRAQIVVSSGAQAGQPLAGVGIRLVNPDDNTTSTAASCVNNPLSDSNGIISCDVKGGGAIGTNQVKVLIGENLGFLVNFKVTVGDPGGIKKEQGDNQSGNPGAVLPLALRAVVTDAYGNILQGVGATWKVTGGNATLQSTISTTDVNGRVSTLVKLGSSGDSTITLTAGTATATFTVHTNVIVGGVSIVTGDQQTAITGQQFSQPLTVRVTDANNNALSGIPVTFTVTSGSAILSSPTATTDANGQAQVTITAGSGTGNIVVTAGAGSGSVATFNLTSRLPGPVVSASGFFNSASGQSGLAACELASLTGTGMVPQVSGSVVANLVFGPWPTTFQGVSISFAGIQAPIYSVSNINGKEQINFQVPCELAPGTVSATVSVSNGSPTTINNIQVLAYSPGIFEYTAGDGTKQAVLLKQDGSFVSASNRAARGETIRMIATGLGQTNPATATNRTGIAGQSVAAQLVIGVNNAGADLVSAEYMSEMIGLYTVAFRVPDDAPSGLVNLVIAVRNADGSIVYSNGSLIPIQ
jgi:uncharacterized protein (TIGR03437 family)